jgi:hypothetical protein
MRTTPRTHVGGQGRDGAGQWTLCQVLQPAASLPASPTNKHGLAGRCQPRPRPLVGSPLPLQESLSHEHIDAQEPAAQAGSGAARRPGGCPAGFGI